MTRLPKRSAFRPRVIQPPSPDDTRGPTPERMRQAQGFVERGNLGRGRTGVVTLRDSPIERARSRNVISQAQYTAALKYRHHWYRAGLASQLSSVELNRIFATDMTSFSGMARTEAQVFHRQRYREAVQHIGMIGASVVYSYTYLDDPTPRIGLIAQDVERRTPGAVAQIDGRKAVDYRKATARARAIGGLLDNLASLPRTKVAGKDRSRKG
jgi:hypothetical protein